MARIICVVVLAVMGIAAIVFSLLPGVLQPGYFYIAPLAWVGGAVLLTAAVLCWFVRYYPLPPGKGAVIAARDGSFHVHTHLGFFTACCDSPVFIETEPFDFVIPMNETALARTSDGRWLRGTITVQCSPGREPWQLLAMYQHWYWKKAPAVSRDMVEQLVRPIIMDELRCVVSGYPESDIEERVLSTLVTDRVRAKTLPSGVWASLLITVTSPVAV
jgi:hypothetical protein